MASWAEHRIKGVLRMPIEAKLGVVIGLGLIILSAVIAAQKPNSWTSQFRPAVVRAAENNMNSRY